MLSNKRPIPLKSANISPMAHCRSGIAWICSNCEIEENNWEDRVFKPHVWLSYDASSQGICQDLSASRTELCSPISVCNQKRLQALRRAAMESEQLSPPRLSSGYLGRVGVYQLIHHHPQKINCVFLHL